MGHIQGKQDFSILIMQKISAVIKFTDAVSGHHFTDFIFLNEEKPSRN